MALGSHSLSKGKKRRIPSFVHKNLSSDNAQNTKFASKKGLIAAVIAIVAILVVSALVLTNCSNCGGDIDQGARIRIDVKQGQTLNSVADMLVEKRVIGNAQAFINKVKARGQESQIKAGAYIVIGGDSFDNIADVLTSGVSNAGVTIPEGYTIKQMAPLIAKASSISEQEFINEAHKAEKYSSEFSFLKGAYNNSMEGFLFPSSYSIDENSKVEDVIKEMLKTYEQQFEKVDMNYAKSKNLTQYDVTTLASIIQKESYEEGDMKQISEVFYNRLRQKIPLGSDVTTYYAVGKDLQDKLTQEDLANSSPYNTRNPNNYGLPPGAICNPGLAALQAAANPSTGSSLYFFFSDSQKKTMFFDKEEEFNAAWKQYGSE